MNRVMHNFRTLGTLQGIIPFDTQRMPVNLSSHRPIERKLRAHRNRFLVSILGFFFLAIRRCMHVEHSYEVP